MPAVPWRAFSSYDPHGDFVALLSYFRLKSYSRVFPFFLHAPRVMRQLAEAEGLVGYSLLAQPFSRRFFTLSAWQNEVTLKAFVHHPPHFLAMTTLVPHMEKTHFLRWTVKGSVLPLQWHDALRRFAADPSRPTA